LKKERIVNLLRSFDRVILFDENDSAGRAILLAGPTLDAKFYQDAALGLAFLDSVAGATYHARAAQDTIVSDQIRHRSTP
jgi:hypothetical protein